MEAKHLSSLAKTLARCACALLVAFATSAPNGMRAAARTPDLFESAPAMAAEHRPPQRDGSIVRRRAVRLNPFAIADRVRFNFFDDIAFEGVVERREAGTGRTRIVQGHVPGQESAFSLAINGEIVVGNARGPDHELYEIRYLGAGLHEVREIDEGKMPPCGTDVAHEIDLSPFDEFASEPPADSDVPAELDVMVVYTPSARAAAGGTTAMQALLDLAVAETNSAYAASGIDARLRLVHRQEVVYTESSNSTAANNFGTDLERLMNPTDGYMDEVAGLRDTYGADMVSLVSNGSGLCGIAKVMTSLSSLFESSAFSVVKWSCATGYYSFGHELGHNLGMQHDRGNAGTGIYPYAYGHRFSGHSGTEFRTVMAYAPGIRIQRFSNPAVSYDGVPTGVPEGQVNAANNALTLQNTAATAMSWRARLPDCGNGRDDDGDGSVDLGDPGCADAQDTSERADGLPCDDGLDNDGDGFADFAGGDPGCRLPSSARENPKCQDGLNNDGQTGTDFDGGVSILGLGNGDPAGADPQCGQPWLDKEAQSTPGDGCGIGPELAVLVPLLRALSRRRRPGRVRC